MSDHYKDGTSLYLNAVAACAAVAAGAAAMGNPALSAIGRMCAALFGTMLSSPSDIRRTAREVRSATQEIEQARDSVKQLLAGVPDDDWAQMSRPEMEKVAEAFTQEVSKTGNVYRELAHTLDQLAKMSFQGAVTAASLAGVLLLLLMAGRIGPAGPLVTAASTSGGAKVQGKAKAILAKLLLVFGSAATLAWIASALLAAFKDPGMTDAVTLTGKDAPAFEQVLIPDLPPLPES